MAGLEDVRAAIFPAAIAVTGGSEARGVRAGRAVGWVRVMRSRVPAFDALEAGDLVLVPDVALDLVAPDAATRAVLVDALSTGQVAGVVVVGDGPVGRSFAEDLVRAGVPSFLTQRTDPATLERSAISFLVNGRAEIDRLAGELERRLERLALTGRDLDALVAEVASTLGRPVALEDRRGERLIVHAPEGGDVASAGRYVAGGSVVARRIALPTEHGTGAFLALPGDRPASELDEAATDRIAPLLALALERDDAVRTARDAARRSEALPAAGPPWFVVVARQASGGKTPDDAPNRDPRAGVRAASRAPAAAPPGSGRDHERSARERVRRDVRLLAPARRLALRGDADSVDLRAVVAPADDDPDADALVRRIAETVRTPVARSRPFTRAGDRAAAEAEARATLEAWEALAEARGEPTGPGSAPVVRADRIAAYRLLVGLHNTPNGRRDADALLEPVLAGRPGSVKERLATLRAVLTHGGVAEAAAALAVHRNTIAYRVRRIEEATGWDLTDAELRLAVLVALELVQTA